MNPDAEDINMKSVLASALFLSLILVYDTALGDVPYYILLLTISIFTLWCLLRYFQRSSLKLRLDFSYKAFGPLDKLLSSSFLWLCFLSIISWMIGVFIGLLNGVDPSLVFRNFFGLVCYAIFPMMLLVSPSVKSLIIVTYLSAFVQMYYGFEKSYHWILYPQTLFIESSISELRSFYNAGFIVIFPLFSVGLARKLLPNKYSMDKYGRFVKSISNSSLITLLTVFALIVPAMSKGFILTTAILLLFVVFVSIIYFFETKILHRNVLLLIVFLCIIVYLVPESFFKVVQNTYSKQEYSNSLRNEQFQYIISDWTLLGNGLGAPLSSGYVRDSTGYGFELTYINIVHKLGIFSIFLFMSYIITLMVAASRIFKKIYVMESMFVIGLMGYLIVGAGNPLLLSSSAVILHCIAMYILVKPYVVS